ncbi:hypothetical protein A4H97_30110 [Niastella yeongjuensis]|uniref:histidine kinase n=1 Tax=Niastella yeongjuensis TaxID=354355 RepID=A0A1V9EPK3_9BACT|nr:histidine kinase dimerization/phosphoacceptor domain -containing protein [Niastella yeongjuensis]OQP48088.1 hypothetical protein A4H97_30110 [Niastella yeongjuensis]SEO26260.1 Two-component sensor histidine kinase, contains HisKA and HATPase domains [Niastella yeongjuensis]
MLPDFFIFTILLVTATTAAVYYYGRQRRSSKRLDNALTEAESLENQLSAAKSSSAEHSAHHEWLTREIHHRVKNNLQMISSLLNLQSAYLTNTYAKTALRDTRHRVQAILLVHQKLDQASIVSNLNLSQYIDELLYYLNNEYSDVQGIRFESSLKQLTVNFELAVVLGLIINEAVGNLLNNAFPKNKPGTVAVRLETAGVFAYKLTIANEGIGLPDNFNVQPESAFAKNLICGLSDQVNANLILENEDGLPLTLIFTATPLSFTCQQKRE